MWIWDQCWGQDWDEDWDGDRAGTGTGTSWQLRPTPIPRPSPSSPPRPPPARGGPRGGLSGAPPGPGAPAGAARGRGGAGGPARSSEPAPPFCSPARPPPPGNRGRNGAGLGTGTVRDRDRGCGGLRRLIRLTRGGRSPCTTSSCSSVVQRELNLPLPWGAIEGDFGGLGGQGDTPGDTVGHTGTHLRRPQPLQAPVQRLPEAAVDLFDPLHLREVGTAGSPRALGGSHGFRRPQGGRVAVTCRLRATSWQSSWRRARAPRSGLAVTSATSSRLRRIPRGGRRRCRAGGWCRYCGSLRGPALG